AAVVTNQATLRDVTGDTIGYVIDPTAYGATASFGGPNQTLRARHVAVHLLPAGSGFNFTTMTPSQGGASRPKPPSAGPAYPPLPTAAAKPLYLAGGILADKTGPVTQAFVADAGGAAARILVVAAGYAKSGDAKADAKALAAAIAPSVAAT